MKRSQIVLGLTLFTVGILSVVLSIRAAESPVVDANKDATASLLRGLGSACRFRQLRILVWVP